jgi:dTDP-4-amino-4,6-dideoxygalactose transaminase
VVEGYNLPLDPLQAALVRVKLPHLPEWTRQRRAVAQLYREGLKDLPVGLPSFRHESEPTFRSYTVLVQNRQAVYEGLRDAGVEVVLHYTPPVYRQPVYPDGLRGSDNLPVTDRLSAELICLPVSPELDSSDVQYAVDAMARLL